MSTEHVLLGLITTKDSLAAAVLDELSITEAAVRASQQETTVESRVPDSTDYMSDRLVAVLERAAQEAKQLQHDYLGTEHLLLALMAVPDTNAQAILQKLNLQPETARTRILQRIESGKQA
jgi:ATP-dependent Clp protease ATP-binding subunit ClpC